MSGGACGPVLADNIHTWSVHLQPSLAQCKVCPRCQGACSYWRIIFLRAGLCFLLVFVATLVGMMGDTEFKRGQTDLGVRKLAMTWDS